MALKLPTKKKTAETVNTRIKPFMKKVKTVPLEMESVPKFTDLRQVMDYKRPLSIFYSGVEYEQYLDILYDLGIRNFLMSYEYLKGKGHKQLRKYSDMHLFIDSGAFTYMNNPEYANYTIEQWEDQIIKYLAWAKKHKDSIFAIADLDLQLLVGNEVVYEWRRKYFEPFMLETGIPVCFIYHEEGPEQWEYICKRYPYIGVSLGVDGTIDESTLNDRFRVAEKYNTLVQGMASTRVQTLVEYPFYTVDSTTWNVGLKYGEISVWKDTKMSRIKKDKFEADAFPAISRYDVKFDFDLIRAEDKTEMIRVNAYAFVQAEKFIHERLRSRMYWLKARTTVIDLNNLPIDFYPSPEWLMEDSHSDTAMYAERMNLNPNYEGILDLIYDATVFLNWDNPEYRVQRDWYFAEKQKGLIEKLHDLYVNRIVPDQETRISDIRSFFAECVSGKNDKLLQLGTNFDRIVKERDSYIEEEEHDLVDLTEDEINAKVLKFLPAVIEPKEEGAPEVEALTEEIYREAGIVPTWDEKGKFVKGQQLVRKPKQVYSKKFPKFACDTCYAAQKCPEYKPGFVCAYHKMFERFDTRDIGDVIQIMQSMVQHNVTRMQRAMLMEVLNGTVDDSVTGFINQNMNLLGQLTRLYESGNPEVLRQTRILRADGTREETTEYHNPSSGSILEKLFSSAPLPSPQDYESVIETTGDVSEPSTTERKRNERYDNLEE